MRFGSFFPEEAAKVDWAASIAPLDKELQKVAPADDRRARTVDKLVQVKLVSGSKAWILVHVEVQSQYDADFAKRMLNYNTHFFEHFDIEVNSFAIFGDERRTWKPGRFGYGTMSKTNIVYPVAKLVTLNRTILDANPNPFVMMVLAHLTAQETHGQSELRAARKVELARRMVEKGFSEEQFDEYSRLMDRVLELPDDLDTRVYKEIKDIQEEYKMAYVDMHTRYNLREGRKAGLKAGINALLNVRFKEAAAPVKAEIAEIDNLAVLQAILDALETVPTLDAVRAVYTPQTSDSDAT